MVFAKDFGLLSYLCIFLNSWATIIVWTKHKPFYFYSVITKTIRFRLGKWCILKYSCIILHWMILGTYQICTVFTMYLAADQLLSEIYFLICLNKATSAKLWNFFRIFLHKYAQQDRHIVKSRRDGESWFSKRQTEAQSLCQRCVLRSQCCQNVEKVPKKTHWRNLGSRVVATKPKAEEALNHDFPRDESWHKIASKVTALPKIIPAVDPWV